MKKKLSHIDKFKACIIQSIDSNDNDVTEELETLGFVPGTEVTVMNKSFLSGPLTVMLRGAKIAIRQRQADIIAVSA